MSSLCKFSSKYPITDLSPLSFMSKYIFQHCQVVLVWSKWWCFCSLVNLQLSHNFAIILQYYRKKLLKKRHIAKKKLKIFFFLAWICDLWIQTPTESLRSRMCVRPVSNVFKDLIEHVWFSLPHIDTTEIYLDTVVNLWTFCESLHR